MTPIMPRVRWCRVGSTTCGRSRRRGKPHAVLAPANLENALAAIKAFLQGAHGAVLLVHSATGEWHVSAASFAQTTDKAATLAEMRTLLGGAPVAASEWQKSVIAEATR